MLSDEKRSKLWSMYQKELKSPPPSPMQMPMMTTNGNSNNLKSPQQRLSYIDTFRLALGENVESFPVDQSIFMNNTNKTNNTAYTYDTTTTTAYDAYDGMDLHALADSKLTVETNASSSSSSSSSSDNNNNYNNYNDKKNDKNDKNNYYNYNMHDNYQYIAPSPSKPTSKPTSRVQYAEDVYAHAHSQGPQGPQGPAGYCVPSDVPGFVTISVEQLDALRSTRESLSEAVHHERSLRTSIESRLEQMATATDEFKIHNDINVDSLKIEVTKQRALIKELSSRHGLEGILKLMHDDVKRLEDENSHLHRRCLILENKWLSETPASEKAPYSMSSDPRERFHAINGDANWQRHGTEVSRLKKELKVCLKENHRLSDEAMKMQARERHLIVAEKLCENIKCKLMKCHEELTNTQDTLLTTTNERDNLKEAMKHLQTDTAGARLQNSRLKEEIRKLRAEIALYQRQNRLINCNDAKWDLRPAAAAAITTTTTTVDHHHDNFISAPSLQAPTPVLASTPSSTLMPTTLLPPQQNYTRNGRYTPSPPPLPVEQAPPSASSSSSSYYMNDHSYAHSSIERERINEREQTYAHVQAPLQAPLQAQEIQDEMEDRPRLQVHFDPAGLSNLLRNTDLGSDDSSGMRISSDSYGIQGLDPKMNTDMNRNKYDDRYNRVSVPSSSLSHSSSSIYTDITHNNSIAATGKENERGITSTGDRLLQVLEKRITEEAPQLLPLLRNTEDVLYQKQVRDIERKSDRLGEFLDENYNNKEKDRIEIEIEREKERGRNNNKNGKKRSKSKDSPGRYNPPGHARDTANSRSRSRSRSRDGHSPLRSPDNPLRSSWETRTLKLR